MSSATGGPSNDFVLLAALGVLAIMATRRSSAASAYPASQVRTGSLVKADMPRAVMPNNTGSADRLYMGLGLGMGQGIAGSLAKLYANMDRGATPTYGFADGANIWQGQEIQSALSSKSISDFTDATVTNGFGGAGYFGSLSDAFDMSDY